MRFPGLSPFATAFGQPDRLSPYVFADLGAGSDFAIRTDTAMASIGVGSDYSLAEHLTVNLAAGHALRTAGATRPGDWMLNAFVRTRF